MTEKKRKLKIGLALGKGTAKGFAHIGVMKILLEHGIKPDMVAGCSAGAIVGALYASGMSPEVMERTLCELNWHDMFDFVVPSKGLIKGDKLEEYLNLLLQNKEFKDLNIPLFIAATNITKKHEVIFHQGSVAKAVRASLAIPGIFTPLDIDGEDYLDGGLMDPVPTDVLRMNGADVIIAVDLSSDNHAGQPLLNFRYVSTGTNFIGALEKSLIFAEINFLKEFLKTTDKVKLIIPKMIRKFVWRIWTYAIDKIIRPTFIFHHFSRARVPQILTLMYTGIDIMGGELTKAKLNCGGVDAVITPTFNNAGWTDIDKAAYFIRRGKSAAAAKIREIKRIISAKSHHLS